MRNALLVLSALGALLLVIFVVLPVLGVIVIAAIVLIALILGALLAAPLLMKLPWFRKRIIVEERGGFRTVRFGNSAFTTGRPGQGRPPGQGPVDPDVIDVEGRELPDKD